MTPAPAPVEFLTAFKGSFAGILRWPQLDDFWNTPRADATSGWHLYALGEPPPTTPASAKDVTHFINEIGPLRREYREDHCGMVYADDLAQPTFVKIFDPHNLGVVCGYSDHPPLPGWIMSKLAPVNLKAVVMTGQRWWQGLIGG